MNVEAIYMQFLGELEIEISNSSEWLFQIGGPPQPLLKSKSLQERKMDTVKGDAVKWR